MYSRRDFAHRFLLIQENLTPSEAPRTSYILSHSMIKPLQQLCSLELGETVGTREA